MIVTTLLSNYYSLNFVLYLINKTKKHTAVFFKIKMNISLVGLFHTTNFLEPNRLSKILKL